MGFASPIQRSAVLFARAHRDIQQFGQSNDASVWDGASACTHTCLQFITWFALGKRLTLDEVNHFAGMPVRAKGPAGPRGMRPSEIVRFVKAMGLPYTLMTSPSFSDVVSKSKLGPVMYAMRYGSAPERRGTVYHGVHARPPYAQKNGATQLTGAENMRHAVLYLGDMGAGHVNRKDPNHGSTARPERPPYDVITRAQAAKEFNDYPGSAWALVPTKKVR